MLNKFLGNHDSRTVTDHLRMQCQEKHRFSHTLLELVDAYLQHFPARTQCRPLRVAESELFNSYLADRDAEGGTNLREMELTQCRVFFLVKPSPRKT